MHVLKQDLTIIMSNPNDAVRLLKKACASDIPTELENQLKSGAMKISLQSKPKTFPGLIMNKIPGPTIDPSKSMIQGQVLGKISKTVTLKYDSNDKVTKGIHSGATKGNIDAFKQFRDIDVQLLTGPKKNNNTSLSGCGLKRKGVFIAQQDVKFSKLSAPVSAGALMSSSGKTPPGPGTKATNFVIPKTLLNSKDVVCKTVRKTDASVRVNIESNKNIEIKKNQIVVHKTPESNTNVKTKIPPVRQKKSPQNHRLHLETANNLNKVTVGSVKISTKTLQNSKPPSSILDLKFDSSIKTKRGIVNEPSTPLSKIPRFKEPLSNSKVTAHQVNMGKSFSRFDMRNQQAENHQKPRFRKFYQKLNFSSKLQESDPCHKINTDVESKKSLNNFDQECPEQCGERFSNVGDLVTHYQEAHEAPDSGSVDQTRDEQIETQQSVIDDFVEALNPPLLIENKNEEKTKTNVEEKNLSVKAAVINLYPLLGVRWRPLLPMLEYFPTANLKSENPVKDLCQDIPVIIKQEILDYDENDDTEVCEVFSDTEEEFADKFDDFAESLAESCGAADLISTNSSKSLSLTQEAVKELHRDSSDVIEITDESDETQRKPEEILQLEDVDNEDKECKTGTQPNNARKPLSVNVKHIFDEDIMKIRDIQRVKLVYWNDSNMAHVQDLDLCLVVNKCIAKITTVLDEDIGDPGIISDYDVVTESSKVVKIARASDSVVVPPPEIISLSDDEDEIETLPSSMGFGQFNRRSQEDYDSDEEYDRMNFGVPDHEDKFNEAQLEENKTTDVIKERTENEHKIDPSKFSNKEKSKDTTSNSRNQIETRNCEVKLNRLRLNKIVKACFVRVEKISGPEESPYAEDSEDDLDEDFEDELDRVFAEIEALERNHVEGETKLETNDLTISDILDSLIGDVMGQVVEPWSEYVTVKRMEGKAEKTLFQRQNDLDQSDIAPSQLESGWDKMEITSQPAESVTQLNYYFTC